MKKFIFLAIGLLAVSAAGAQQKWTLRQCIDHAVENNIDIRRTALTVESAELDLNSTRNSRLPDLNAGVNQNFSFGRTTSDDDNRYINTQASNTSFSLSTSIPVFGGFRINNQVKADKLNLEAASANLEKVKQSVELAVAGYYLDVLFKKEILAVRREQTALTRKQVENTVKMIEGGRAAPALLYDIKAQLAQNGVDEVNASNDFALSRLNLSQALDLEFSPEFDVAGIEADAPAPESASDVRRPDEIYADALGIRPSVKEAELRLESSRYQVKIAKSAWWPQISLGASFGDGYYYMFGQDFKQLSFADQLRNKHSDSVGLNMSIPIFNKNRTRNSVRAAKLGVANSSLALEDVRLSLYKEIQQAWQRMVAARARYDATTGALEAAGESFRAMELRYENGKATVYEYSEAAAKLSSSRSEQAQAKYDFLFSSKILDFYRGVPINI
jgi:outer membrane protein